jgi:hypothetical protein
MYFGLCPQNLVNSKIIFAMANNNYKIILYVVNELLVLLEQHIYE